MGERVALVIGNSAYADAGPLKNPVNDAQDIERRLDKFGFETELVLDATAVDLDRALKRFKKALKDAEVGAVFFAGHGLQIDDENYLIAIDTDTSDEIAAKHSSLALNRVIETMEKGGTMTNIINLDACRDNPFRQMWARSLAKRGLAPVYVPKGTLIAYATSPGQVAEDGKGKNGEYTAALLKHIDSEDLSIESMMKRVRNTLSASTSGRQISWEHTSLAGEFFFNRSIGRKIARYAKTSLKDKLFVLKPSNPVHKVIEALKVSDWYTQNPAISSLSEADISAADNDSLFVLGRNVYQASCGNAWSATNFILEFPQLASGLATEKWRAILDGMLFEVFFDATGQLRASIKDQKFERLFDLQEHDLLADSFDFLSECLTQYPQSFHVVPGKNRQIAIDVVTKKDAEGCLMDGIRLGGQNILWLESEDDEPDFTSVVRRTVDVDKFEGELSTRLGVPRRLLKVSYANSSKRPPLLKVPWGWSVAVRSS